MKIVERPLAIPPDFAVMLIGHGTRSPQGHLEFLEQANQVAKALTPVPVLPALLELQRPTIAEAWQQLIAGGAKRIIAVPLLLWSAGHARQDIPESLNRLATETQPAVEYFQTDVLADHPAVIQRSLALWGRLLEGSAVLGTTESVGHTTVLLAGRGSTSDRATIDMQQFAVRCQRTAEDQSKLNQIQRVEVGFVAMAKPTIGELCDELGQDRSLRQVIIQPHLLFSGELNCTLCRYATIAAERYPHIRWCVSDTLGPHALITAAVVDRVTQAMQHWGKKCSLRMGLPLEK